MLDDDDIASIVSLGGDLESTSQRLIGAANERGGRDNITVVLFRLDGAEDAPDEQQTLLGPSAEHVGLDAEAVRAGVASLGGAAAPPPPRRRRPTPSRRAPAPRKPRRRGALLLKSVATLAVVGLLALAAVLGARQIWFVGTDAAGNVALFRGLPYELPFGLELYSEQQASDVPLEALPVERRQVAVDHEWRSRDDAASLIADLEAAAIVATPFDPGRSADDGGTNDRHADGAGKRDGAESGQSRSGGGGG